MSPRRAGVTSSQTRFPRVSGDEPYATRRDLTRPSFSPRERG